MSEVIDLGERREAKAPKTPPKRMISRADLITVYVHEFEECYQAGIDPHKIYQCMSAAFQTWLHIHTHELGDDAG